MALANLTSRLAQLSIGRLPAVSGIARPLRASYATGAASSASAAVSPIFAAGAADVPEKLDAETTSSRPRNGKVVARTQKYGTTNFRVSPKKLNKLAQQIRGLPVDEAILQMNFSHKRPRMRIRNMLYNAKATAINVSKMNQGQLYVKEAYVGKGRYEKRMLLHGRGRFGIMTRKSAHMKVVLEERTKAVERQYMDKLMKKMLKDRAKWQSPNANLDLKPAGNFALFDKEVKIRRL